MSGFYMERDTLLKDAKSKFKQSVVFIKTINTIKNKKMFLSMEICLFYFRCTTDRHKCRQNNHSN